MKLLGGIPVRFSYYQTIRRRATLEGPTLVLGEAEQRNCAISEVFVSRRTDPALIRRLRRALGADAPIVEVSEVELDSLSGGIRHGGVVAILRGRRRQKGKTERGLWALLRLSVPGAAQLPEKFDE